MDSRYEEATTFAHAQFIENLKNTKPYYAHPYYVDPDCHPECKMFNNHPDCHVKVKHICPTKETIKPLEDLKEAISDHQKKIIKQKLNGTGISGKKLAIEYLWLTLNPKPSIRLKDFVSKISKFTDSNMFQDYCGIYEQRGIDEKTSGKGFHAHILFKRHTPLGEGLPPTQIRRNTKDSFKKFMNVSNPQILNFQFVDIKFAQDKINYIKNPKDSKEKRDKQDQDVLWRRDNDLPPFIGNIDILEN